MRTTTGIVYATRPGYRPLELDVHLPDAPKTPCPAVVFIHGGGWRIGSRRAVSPALEAGGTPVFERITGSGMAVLAIDHRLSGEARWPAQAEDVAAALDWVATAGHEHGIDRSRVALWGASSGGHLAAYAALDDACPLEICAAACWYPVTDLVALHDDVRAAGGDPALAGTEDTREGLLLGSPVAEVVEVARSASPLTHVRPGAPPFLVLHGGADTDVPPVQSRRLADALGAAGNSVSLEIIDGAGHQWQGAPADTIEHVISTTVSYLAQATSGQIATAR